MTFEAWKSALWWDARKTGMESGLQNITDYVLYLLWEDGVGPSVEEILGEGQVAA